MSAFFGDNIKNRLRIITDYALFAIKKRFIEGTVGNIMIPYVSLIVLLNEIVNVLITQNPAISVYVGLINGGGQNRLGLALSVDGFF